MSLCYDGEKWLMITLSIVAISLTVGLVLQYTHGFIDGNNNGKDDVIESGYEGYAITREAIANQTRIDILAQNSDSNSNYLQYSNSDIMNIKYPSDWVYNHYNVGFITYGGIDQYAVFVPSSEVSLNQTNMTQSAAYVSIGKDQDLPYENMPLDLYFEYMKKLRGDNGDNITNTGKTKLSDGSPAYEIDFTSNNTRKSVLVTMNNGSESYYFEYTALPDKFNTYLPIAQQMFKTLSFK